MANGALKFASSTASESLKSSSTPAKLANPSSISKVRVVTRVRPFLAQEISSRNVNPVSCISVVDQGFEPQQEVTVHLKDPETSRNECYQLDSYFGQEEDNVSQIFLREVEPLIPGIFHGCNATVFAYGATGSGKTYTMQGTIEKPGLMPLAMSKILAMCEGTSSAAEISYYEVYLDRCYDLLELKAKEIAILDDKDGQIHLRGLSQVLVKSMAEFQDIFSCGIQRRKIAHTNLNDVSSRSHGVLVISVSSPCDESRSSFTGKLNLIDLAGNENNRRTCNEGIRLQESAKINQSLFALSNVIYALNRNLPRVPYRESKLTRILQDSLGGASRALMVACLNPGEYQECVHTVSLAARSRHISNYVSSANKKETPNVKVDMEEKLRAWLESKGKTKSKQRMEASGSPSMGKTSGSMCSLKKTSSVKTKATTNQGGASNAKERTINMAFRNLQQETEVYSCTEGQDQNADDATEYSRAGADESFSKSKASHIGDAVSRKALSPINTNGNYNKPLEELSSPNKSCSVLFEPKTPKTPFPFGFARKEFDGTPLDKFSARSSTIKNCLVQEYIYFLNTASRSELLEIKGIGVKIAEYIIELRETSPLESLNDMEKIGLSSKQIYNLFTKAARGVFERADEETAIASEEFSY